MFLNINIFCLDSRLFLFTVLLGLSLLLLYFGLVIYFDSWSPSAFDALTVLLLASLNVFIICPMLLLCYLVFADKKRIQLILQYGVNVQAKAISREFKAFLSDGGERYEYRFLFKNQEGKFIEQSWLRNFLPTITEQKVHNRQHASISSTYPQSLFSRYPEIGEEFELLYIPNHERHFLILNTGNSEFARNIQAERSAQEQERQLSQLQTRLTEAKVRMDMDPFNQEYQDKYNQAERDLDQFERSI